jgi:predicted GNAT family N-acyltransferase
MNLLFSIAPFGSDLHQQSILLRNEILRKPLGLLFSDIELANEINQHHLVMILNDKVEGTTLLVPATETTYKLRQFAISEDLQGKGYGKKLVAFTEEFSRKKGCKLMELHARETACKFYEKCGYSSVGDEFEEVGLPHYKMTKKL